MLNGMAMANALMACPEGKENWSGGSTLDQQCSSRWHGRLRLLAFFTMRKSTIVAVTATALAPNALNRGSPPNSSTLMPMVYQIQPSPRRVDQIIQVRSQRGARQRFRRRMTRWSRVSMNRQTILPAVMTITSLSFEVCGAHPRRHRLLCDLTSATSAKTHTG